jgi:hypothetical protein
MMNLYYKKKKVNQIVVGVIIVGTLIGAEGGVSENKM